MTYAPAIKSATPKQRFEIAGHIVVLLGDIVSAGPVQYRFIVVVYDPATERPCYFVTSETNFMAEQFGGGSHFLCVFDAGSHANHGGSDDWADETKFTAEALRLIADKYRVQPA